MKTLRLSLPDSSGHPVEVPYTLPESVRFDCFTPMLGMFHAFVDVSADEVELTEVVHPDGGSMLIDELTGDDAVQVLEQAGDVCAVLERALTAQGRANSAGWEQKGITPDTAADARVLTTIADVARHEQALRHAWGCIPPALRTGNYPPDTLVAQVLSGDDAPNMDSRAVRVLHAFIHTALVGRAQDVATKAAQARQQAWEAEQAEHMREVRCDARDEVAP